LIGVSAKQLDLAHLLEDEDLARFIAIELDTWNPSSISARIEYRWDDMLSSAALTSRVISTILEPLQAIEECVDDVATIL
jgi:hypothetical protein